MMLPIKSVPFEDIELFLSANDKTIPHIIDLAYDMTLNMLENSKYSFIPDSLTEWLIASNFSKMNVELKIYNEHDIMSYSTNELCDLSELLNTDNLNKDHLINILNYLGKISNINIRSLPEDVLFYIMQFMDLRSIIMFCETCKSIIKISNNLTFRNFLLTKFVNNNVNMSKFTMKQILACSKLFPTRKKMTILNEKLYLIDFFIIHEINISGKSIKSYSHDGVNKIIQYNQAYKFGDQWWKKRITQSLIQLKIDGTIWIKDMLSKKEEKIKHFTENIADISTEIIKTNYFGTKEIFCLVTINNITYKMINDDLVKFEINESQIYNNIIYTTDLSFHIQYCLLSDGTVNVYDNRLYKTDKISQIDNAIQIVLCPTKFKLVILTGSGEIYYCVENNNLKKEERLTNIIIEITINRNKLCALDKNNVIHIINMDNSQAIIEKIQLKDTVDDIW